VREGLEKSLIDRVRNRISPHVAPREVVFRDSLPMTATGKIMRRELREAEIGRNDPSPGAESERR
jgi:acetyl-CoA synthetase